MATPVPCAASRHLPGPSAPPRHSPLEAWIQDLQRSDYSPEALKALRRAQELGEEDGACRAAHVAYVLVAEVLGATGAPTPWGADVAGAAVALRRQARQEGEPLERLLERAQEQRAPAKVGLRDLCAAIFELQELGEQLKGFGFTAEGLRNALQAGRKKVKSRILHRFGADLGKEGVGRQPKVSGESLAPPLGSPERYVRHIGHRVVTVSHLYGYICHKG